jgi:hypothetical protein
MKYSLKELLLNEYSDKIIKQMVDRFKAQDRNLEDEQLQYYIERFDQLKNSLRQRVSRKETTVMNALPQYLQPKDDKDIRFMDILQWKKWKEFEKIVDLFPAPPGAAKRAAEKLASLKNDAETDADLIYNKDQLEIYQGDNESKCVRYAHTMGNDYSWCIARTDSSNMYTNYRFSDQNSRMFYFVFDRSRSSSERNGQFEDVYHAVVIHVFQNGRYGFSTAQNAGDSIVNNWNELGQHMPPDLWKRLRPLQDLFAYRDPSAEEKEAAALKGKALTARDFADLSYNTKLAYINMGNTLTKEMIDTLDLNLKNQYINLGGLCPLAAIIDNKPLVKRYITIQFERLNRPVNADYMVYMTDEQKEKYYQKYGKEAYIDYTHLAKYFPKQLQEYITEMVDSLDYLPDWTIEYMDTDQRELFYKYSPAYKSSEIVSQEDKSMVIYYYLIAKRMTSKNFEETKPEQRKAFMAFVKDLFKTGNIKSYTYYRDVLPKDIKIENDNLYMKFEDSEKWYNEKDTIQEAMYDDWDKYLLMKKAGLIR